MYKTTKWLLLSFCLYFIGCGTGLNHRGNNHVLNFIAVKGSVNGGKITVFTLDSTGNEGAVLATGTTEDGFLTATFAPITGPIGAKITGGEYLEESTGVRIPLGNFSMSTLLSDLPKSGSTVYISALTEMAAQYARSLIASGASVESTVKSANKTVAVMAGLTDITLAPDKTADPTKKPEDPTSETAKYGLVLAGLSQQANTLGVDGKSLVSALAEDLQDGKLDGTKNSTPVKVDGGSNLQNDAWTNGLTAGMDTFVNTNTNNPGFTTTSKPVTYVSETVAVAVDHVTITNVTATPTSGTFGASDVIPLSITFSGPVTVKGTPTLKLNSSGTASYTSGSGTQTLTFTYTVQPGDNSSRLDCSTQGAIALLGGRIYDAKDVDATLVLPTLTSTGSLKSNTNIVINTVPTAPTSLTATNGDATVPLSWTAPTGYFGTVTYSVYRGTASGSQTLIASSLSTTSYSDTTVINDQTYYYVVKAVAPGGTSPASNEVSPSPYHPVFTSISFAVKSGSSDRLFNNGTSTTILRATTLDQRSIAFAGRSVTVAIPTNGGTITTNPVTSNSLGISDFTLTSSTTKGTYSFTASSSGITSNAISIIYDPCAEGYLTNTPFAAGKGSASSPYWICTRAQFNAINTNSAYTTRYFVLAQSISMSDGVTSVGNSSYPFRGSFDGQNYSLTGVSLTGSANNVGLFSYVNGGTIKNLTVSASSVSASAYNNVGVLIGYATGAVMLRNVSVSLSGAVTGAQYVGGLVGNLDTSANTVIIGSHASGAGSVTGSSSHVGGFAGNIQAGTVQNSYSSLTVSSIFNNSVAYVGGFAGKNAGVLSSSYSTGSVSTTTALAGQVGGLVGNNSGTINYFSYSSSSVSASGTTSQDVGALVGYNSGNISQSYSTGTVTAKADVGGLVGYHSGGTIQTSYSTSTVSGGGNNVGGLVGYSSSTINDCYASGNVSSSSSSGLAGAVGTIASGTVSRVYSTGAPTGSAVTNVGGLIGSNSGTLASGFWNTATSSQGTSAAGTGLSTAAMKNIVNYVSQGWDFGTVWQKSDATGYPIFQWQKTQTRPTVASLFNGGDGTVGTPYLISTAQQLGNVAYAIQLNAYARTAYYKMTTDIDLNGAEAPSPSIGCSSYPFSGKFDGQSHEIQNFSITGALNNVGLFGYIDAATIKDLTVNASTVSASSYDNVGAVIGYATGAVHLSNITLNLSGQVSGHSKVGGFAGYLNTNALSSMVSLSATNAASGSVLAADEHTGGLIGYMANGFLSYASSVLPVSSTSNSGTSNVGGLIGYLGAGRIQKCSSTGTVTNNTSGAGTVAGLVANFQGGTISTSYSTGAVSATSGSGQFGGLVGIMVGGTTINMKSYSTSSVTTNGSSSENVGGLVGYMFGGSISTSYSTGAVVGGSYVGGLIGQTTNSSPVVTGSYSTSNVTGTTSVGGLIGYVGGANSIADCYAQGSVTSNGGTIAAGAIGSFNGGTVNRIYSTGAVSGTTTTLKGCLGSIPNTTTQGGSWFWDTTTSGQGTSAGGRGVATAGMKTQSTFVNEGWDFNSVWQIPTGTGYPILQWQQNQTPLDIGTFFAGGDGSVSSPYQISNATQLQSLANMIQLDYGARFSYYKLTADIDLTGLPMPVIGTSTYPFSGVFDGFDHQIQNYSVTANSNYVGLFGYVDGGTIQNLTVTAGNITGGRYNYIGTVVGYATGLTTLSKVYVDLSGTLNGTQYVGGLAGQLDTTAGTIVSDCHVTGSGGVSGYTSGPGTSMYVGGLAGYFGYGNMDKSYATIPLTSVKNDLGGLLGRNHGIVTSSYSTGAVSTTQSSAYYIGGLIGYNDGTTDLKCYSTSNVTATTSGATKVAGISGYNGGTIKQSYSTGTVNSLDMVGGIVGRNSGNINQSYSSSAVTGTTKIGGIAGYNDAGLVSDCYASGSVTLNDSGVSAGSVVGEIAGGTYTHVFGYGAVTGGTGATSMGGFGGTIALVNKRLNGVFWDKNTSYTTSAGTTGYKSSYTGSSFGIATADLQKSSTFVAATYDFFSVWQLPAGGGQYPNFQWQQAQTPITIDTLFNAGSGTKSAPYEINTAIQLQNLAYAVQLGSTGQNSYYILTADIDLAGYISPIIGTSTYPFSGTFDGQSHSISNYQVTAVDDNTGLFGYVADGTIKNLTLNATAINGQDYNYVGTVVGQATTVQMTDVTVSLTGNVNGNSYVGGLIGRATTAPTVLTQCLVTDGGSGSISATSGTIGGLVGQFDGTGSQIDSSHSAIAVSTSGGTIGGLVGYLYNATIQSSFSTGTVAGGSTTGGIVGNNEGYVKNCYSTSSVSGSSSVGGLAGSDGGDYAPDGHIYQSYSTGSVTATSDNVGGLVGMHWNGTIDEAYSTGNVSGVTNIGGLIGYSRANVTDAYTTGNVTSTGDRLAGAIGWLESATVTRVYAANTLTGTVTYKGGFLGYRNGGSLSNCFWDSQVSGSGSVAGNNAGLSGATGNNTATMKTDTTFTNASWNFTTRWQIPPVVSYPVFQWQSVNLTGGIAALFNGGDGSEGDPYQVNTETQLNNMSTALQNSIAAQSAFYKLTSNITLSGAGPIIGTSTYPFTGTFDGNSKTISNYAPTVAANNAGLFGYVGTGALLKNFTLETTGVDGTGYSYVGSVVGRAVGPITLSKITVDLTGLIKGVNYVGGLVGAFDGGDIIQCIVGTSGGGSIAATGYSVGGLVGTMTAGGVVISRATIPVVSTVVTAAASIGGLVGSCGTNSTNYGAIVASYSTGNVTDNQTAGALGGLVGTNTSCAISQQSYATGNVSSNGAGSSIGGLVGSNNGIIRLCYATGTVAAANASDVGGLIGAHGGTLTKSYSTSNVSGDSNVGGLVGTVSSTITDCYATGSVSVATDKGGGAIGSLTSGTVSYIYSIGAVSGAGTNQGGLIGSASPTVYGGNWDADASGNATSSAGIAQTTANSKLAKTYVNQGWDFGTTWVRSAGTSYPIFQWQQANAPTAIATLFNGGTGTPASPFEINTAAQLQNLALAIQQSTIAQTASYVLTSDINVAATTKPIIGSAAYPFMGDFNGQGHAITNYSLVGNNDYTALFGYTKSATIRNFSLAVSTVSATKYNYVGTVVGYALNTNIINVPVTLSGAVSGRGYVGGLVGSSVNNSSTIATSLKNSPVIDGASGSVTATQTNLGGLAGVFTGSNNTLDECYTTIAITSTYAGASMVGGLVGENTGLIKNAHSTGNVTNNAASAGYVGGLVGTNGGTITGLSYSTSTVTTSLTTGIRVGGLTGNNSGTISNSYSTGSVTGYQYVGGLAGQNTGTIDQTYSTSATTGAVRVGGLIGETSGTVTDSYAKGTVVGDNGNYVGGAIGLYSGGSISRFSSVGAVSGTSATNIGGLVGANTTSGPTFGGVWDKDTSGISTNTGSGCSVLNYCGVPYSTTHMKEKITYTNNGWNFYNRWVMPTGAPAYPFLQWQQPLNPTAIGDLFNGGAGTSASPYDIATAAQLENFAYAVQMGTVGQGAYYSLSADINVSGRQMPVIGNAANPFSGYFNGNNHTISNYAAIATEHYTGLFGYVSGGTIQNLTMNVSSLDGASYNYIGSVVGYASGNTLINNVTVNLSGDLKGNQYVGGFAGSLSLGTSGVVKNCHVYNASAGTVTGNYQTGGFAGYLSGGLITQSHAAVPATSVKTSDVYLGGFVGQSSGTISHSYSTGAVTDNTSGAQRVGGFVGDNAGTINDKSYSTSTVSASTASNYVGGLVGVNSGTVTMSYATGSVTGYDYAGGLVGYNSGNTTQTYATGAVSGHNVVGGLVGSMANGSLYDSYATGAASISSGDVGGAIGNMGGGTVYRIYSTGTVTGSGNAGGLVGNGSGGYLYNSVWDTTTSGQSSSARGNGFATSLMKKSALYASRHWDFKLTWQIVSGSYPTLQWQSSESLPALAGLFAAGEGTKTSPFEISTSDQLGNMAYAMQVYADAQTAYYVLTTDINLTGAISPVIGSNNGTFSYPFKGFFDGQGHTISNYSITANADYIGLFGYVDGATIQNFDFTVSNITGTAAGSNTGPSYIGGVVGYATGLVDFYDIGVTHSGTISGYSYVGGFAGKLDVSAHSIFESCTVVNGGSGAVSASRDYIGGFSGNLAAGLILNSSSEISATSSYANADVYVGGFVGSNSGTISSSYSTGAATDNSGSVNYIGGFTGNNIGTINKQSYATGAVSASSNTNYVGGLAGANSGTLNQVYATGSVAGYNYVGGLVGNHSGGGSLSESYATGAITSSANYAGGLVGNANAVISDSYARGNVACSGGNYAGGAVGYINNAITVSRIYSTGAVSGSSGNKGGLVGNYGGTGTVTNGFWDTTTSSNGSSALGTGNNTMNMQTASTYSTWTVDPSVCALATPDPNYTWKFTAVSGVYPILGWQ